MFKKLKFGLYLSSAIIIALGLSVSLQSLLAAWTAPTAVAPSENVYPPINESGVGQTKLGGLLVNCGTDIACAFNGSSATNGLVVPNGRVGIGTTSPSFKLEIHTGIGADGIYLKNGLNNIGNLTRYVSSDSGVLGLYDSNALKISLNAKANVDSYINNGGRVGIGTASPLSQLSVGASGETNSTLYAYSFNSKAVHGYAFGGGGTGVYGSGGGYGVYGTSTTYSIYGDNSNSSGYSVYAKQTNSNGYAIFANGGLNYFSGSIRIGEVSVAMVNHKLAVQGSNSDSSKYALYVENSSSNPLLAVRNDGNVGIGKTDPSNLLHLYRASGNNAELDIQSVSGANKHWAIYHDRTTDDLRFWNNTPSGEKNILTITNEGNVGIGTTDPGVYKLNVNGDAYIGGNNGNVLTKTSTGGVTNDGLPNCAAGAYLKWDGAKWICAMSPSGDKHYFVTSEKYDGNLGGISGANAKCNSSTSALPGKAYYAQLDSVANGWGMTGVHYFNNIYGQGKIMIDNYISDVGENRFWNKLSDAQNCHDWTTNLTPNNGDWSNSAMVVIFGNLPSMIGTTKSTNNLTSCGASGNLLCVEY